MNPRPSTPRGQAQVEVSCGRSPFGSALDEYSLARSSNPHPGHPGVEDRNDSRYSFWVKCRARIRDSSHEREPIHSGWPVPTRSAGCLLLGFLVLSTILSACAASSGQAGSATGVLNVVAAENFWGSLAAQLGGKQVHVTSIVTDPNADPHEYESSSADARLIATSNYVILNGAGYDDWANKLLNAQPGKGRKVFTVATLLGRKGGDNPHFWYSPTYVFQVIKQMTADFKALEPQEAGYFSAQYDMVVNRDLAPYRQRLAYIQHHFSGTPVASTESVFQYLADYLRLDVVTPYPFMKAVSEATDPPAASTATFDRQIQTKAFKVLVYNVQTVTPLTTRIKEQAAQKGIPATGVSETIQPPIASFEKWMDGELDNLINALTANALGR